MLALVEPHPLLAQPAPEDHWVAASELTDPARALRVSQLLVRGAGLRPGARCTGSGTGCELLGGGVRVEFAPLALQPRQQRRLFQVRSLLPRPSQTTRHNLPHSGCRWSPVCHRPSSLACSCVCWGAGAGWPRTWYILVRCSSMPRSYMSETTSFCSRSCAKHTPVRSRRLPA
eukprot:3235022-Rhodomonas_salina.1